MGRCVVGMDEMLRKGWNGAIIYALIPSCTDCLIGVHCGGCLLRCRKEDLSRRALQGVRFAAMCRAHHERRCSGHRLQLFENNAVHKIVTNFKIMYTMLNGIIISVMSFSNDA